MTWLRWFSICISPVVAVLAVMDWNAGKLPGIWLALVIIGLVAQAVENLDFVMNKETHNGW